MRLSQLPVGAEGIVRSVASGADGQGRRLLEVGFVPGTRVRVERRAPLGDPTVFTIRSTRLALRRSGADLVEVDLLDGAPTGTPPADTSPSDRSRASRLRRRG